MSRSEFQFTEGTSNKFWAIELNGKSHTVHFGRIGTSGQAQTKEFDSEDEAKRSHDKLIAEKVKKGYTEVTAGTTSAGTPTPKVKKSDEPTEDKSKTKPARNEEQPAAPEPPTPAATANANITRTIDLEPEDLQFAEYPRKWRPRARPEPRPFDLNHCLEAISSVKPNKYGYVHYDWPRLMPAAMTGHEAHFWLTAIREHSTRYNEKPDVLARKLSKMEFKEALSFAEAKELTEASTNVHAMFAMALTFALTPHDMVALALSDWSTSSSYQHHYVGYNMVQAFADYVLPYLSEEEVRAHREEIRDRVEPDQWPNTGNIPPVCVLAGHLGMHDQVRQGLANIQESGLGSNANVRFLVLSLGNPAWVESEGRRFEIRFTDPQEIRRWLAITRYSGLDLIRDSILAADSTYDYSSGSYNRFAGKEQAERLLQEFCRVKAPEAAPHMLELKLSSKAPSVARRWLDEQVGNAIAGLIPAAAGRGKLADAAVEYLRDAKKKGHEKLIRDCLQGTSPEIADSIKKSVLDFAEKEYPPLDAKSIPPKLKSAFEAGGKKGKLPAWAAATLLPPLIIGEKRLADEQTTAVLEALQRSTPGKADPIVAAVKEHADPASTDAFAWKLFQLWQGEGCPSKEKWAMGAIGLLGGDASALKITPLVRNWPGESQHQRAVFGLECLRAIGSDTALMQLNGIAQKLKFKGLKQKATEAMEAIATEKGLTRSQLEDRIVPDCDLDERGSRVFDFGPRQFRFVLGPEMKPMLKDGDGKVKGELPKPGAKDDAAKANEAIAAWKLMKKQIKEVANIQAQRLEQAMVTGRRWSVTDFETLLVKHPLMTNLVRLLLWGGYDKKGQLTATFRVTEDQCYADAKDAEFKLKGIEEVGIVHPLQLTEEQKSARGEIFSDYEIVPPFPQLGRTAYKLEKDEEKATEIKRFVGTKLPAPTLVFGLEKYGWVRGLAMDAGCFDEHSKPFPAANVTAVVHYEGTVGMGYIDPNETVTLESCYFVAGQRGPSGYSHKEQMLKLCDVNPVAVSEVLSDLTALAAKAK